MNCPNCGNVIPDGIKFCTHCGVSLADAAKAAAEPAVPATPEPPAAPTQPIQVPAPAEAPAQVTRPLDAAPTQPIQPPASVQQPPAPAQMPQQPAYTQQPTQQMPPQGQQPFAQSAQPDMRAAQPQAPQSVPVGTPPAPQQKKPRKGLIIGILAAVVAAAVAIGIGVGNKVSDDISTATTEPQTTEATTPAPAQSENPAVGSWELTGIEYGGFELAIDPSAPDAIMYMAFDFKDDGTGTVYLYSDGEGENGTFSYTVDGNNVYLVDTNGADLAAEGYDVQINGDQLILSGEEDGQRISMTFTKVSSGTIENHYGSFTGAAVSSSGVSSGTTNDIGNLMENSQGTGQMVADVTGSWTLDSVSISGTTITAADYREATGDNSFNMEIVFNSDGSGVLSDVMEGVSDSVNFTYTFDGTNILIYDEGSSTPDTSFTITYDETNEMIVLDYPGEGMQMTFYRTAVN